MLTDLLKKVAVFEKVAQAEPTPGVSIKRPEKITPELQVGQAGLLPSVEVGQAELLPNVDVEIGPAKVEPNVDVEIGKAQIEK